LQLRLLSQLFGALVVRGGIHEGLHGESDAFGFGIGTQDLTCSGVSRQSSNTQPGANRSM
jgi:hypothetical protein